VDHGRERDDDEETMTVRSKIAIVTSGLMACVISSLPVALVLSQLREPLPSLAIAAGVAVVLLAMARSLRLSFTVAQHGVFIKNYFETVTLEWEDIERVVAVNTALGFVPTSAIGFDLPGQRWRGAHAQASPFAGGLADRERLLVLLKRQSEAHGVPCPVELAPNGTWDMPSDTAAAR